MLTFRHGRFEIHGDAPRDLDRSYWTRERTTQDLQAAVKFREIADEKTEKLFQSLFQTHYTLPDLTALAGVALDPHQRKGIEWVLKRKRSYLAHCPGAGKTAQAVLSAYFARGTGQSVFIVPPSLVMNWEREIGKVSEWIGCWISIGRVMLSNQKETVAWRADIIVVPDSMLTKDWVYTQLSKLKIKLLAVDEASRFKESTSERSIALFGGKNGQKIYRGIFRRARHVVLLDGSPMPNRPIELWAPTFALHPEAIDCMSQDDFGYRYCGARPNERGIWEFKYSSNEEELRQRLQKDFMHVVTEDQLTHPERLRSMVFTSEDVRSAEQKTWELKHLHFEIQGKPIGHRGWRDQIRAMGEEASRGEMAHWRLELGKRKVPYIAQYVRERLEKGESILLFVWHRYVALSLGLQLGVNEGKCGVVVGGTFPRVREEYFSKFQKGELKLIIGNIQAMGRGHNLQRADRVIFGEFSWTDELNKQCEKRASRRGNTKKNVKCEYIVCPDSMDEIVLNSVFSKEKRVKRVIG